MIKKILKLQNVGLLQDATQDGAISLGKVTAIYADNGRGKSTLAAILRSCQLGDVGRLNARKTIDGPGNPKVKLLLEDGSHVEFTENAWTSQLPDIVIFDSEFVELNVYSGFEVRADQRQSLLEFALGHQTVQLKQQIDQLIQEIDAQTRKRATAEKTLIGLAPPYNIAQFIALQPVPDAQQQIDALQKRIGAAKNAQILAARKDPASIGGIQFDTGALFAVLKTQIQDVEKSAEALVNSHLSKHDSKDFEDWVSRGQQYLGGPECPFCRQAISGLSLIEAYRSYFNKTYTDLKQQVAELELEVATGFSESKIEAIVSAAATNTARIEAWKDQLNVTAPTLDDVTLGTVLKQVRGQLLALVGVKQRAPLEQVGSQADVDAATTAISGITQAIDAYNAAVQLIVSQIEDFRMKLGAENTTVLVEDIRKLEAAKKRVLPEVMSVVAEYSAAESERKRLDGEKTRARKQLDALMEATLQRYQTSINKLLAEFGAEFSIEQLKPTYLGGGEPRSEYGLCVRNKSVKLGSRADIATGHSFATALSEADKRTLAFSFFIARLKADENLATKLVVLDDPVSSLDRNRRHQSLRHIVNLAGDCKQLIVSSHDAYFVRELRERLSDQKPVETRILTIRRVGQGYSTFAQCDIDDICSSDYHRHHRLVADYVDGMSTANTRDIAKAIRPLLEGYYHRRFPGKIPRKMMFGHIIALADKTPAGDPLAHLKPILKEMGDVNDYAKQFHHDTNPDSETVPVVDGELLSYAKRTLQLIYQNG